MDILGFEIDIYLVIVLVAVVFVMCIIFMLSKFMTMKKPASKKKKKKPVEHTGLLPEKPHNQIEAKPAGTAMPNPQDKAVNSPAVEATAKSVEKPIGKPTLEATTKQEEILSKLPVLQIQQAPDSKEGTSSGKPPEHEIAAGAGRAWETGEVKDQAEKTGTTTPTMSRLWESEGNKDTKEEEEEEPEKEEESGGVMDIFGEDEEEDSEISLLATGLNDVDLDTLMKLSKEVSEILPRSNLVK